MGQLSQLIISNEDARKTALSRISKDMIEGPTQVWDHVRFQVYYLVILINNTY